MHLAEAYSCLKHRLFRATDLADAKRFLEADFPTLLVRTRIIAVLATKDPDSFARHLLSAGAQFTRNAIISNCTALLSMHVASDAEKLL